MLGIQLTIGSLMIVSTAVFHVLGLAAFLAFLDPWLNAGAVRRKFLGMLLALLTAVLGVFFLHTVEIWSWAFLYVWLGEFDDIERALYFSCVTFTTLGYGDVTLGQDWQLLGGLEAANGIILVGVSTAFVIAVLRNLRAAAFGTK